MMSAHVAKKQMISEADANIYRARRTAAEEAVGGSVAQLVDIPGFEVTQMCDVRSCYFATAEHGQCFLTCGLGRL